MEELADLSIAKRIERDNARSHRAIEKARQEVNGDADMVNNPPHYHIAGTEVIHILEEMGPSYDGIVGFHVLTAAQYILRAHQKNGWQDIEKANWHLQRAIAARFNA